MKKAYQIDMDRMRKKAEEAARAASQAPVERKGEVREELLEDYLSDEFPMDTFKEVKKGQRGADVIQTVMIKGEAAGNILHESKDVLNFDEKWVAKLLNDMSKVDATVGFIFTKVMPKKSKGFVEEREGGRVIICSEYPILRQLVSTTRKLIQSERKANDKSEDQISPKLKDLLKYLNSNEFRIQTRKILNGIKKDGEQIDKDERSFENQIKNRKKNLDDSKRKNINGVITSLVSNAGLSEDILDIEDDDFLIGAIMKDTNPFDLKVLAKAPKDYLDTDEFFEFLVKKNISVRKDNLPRFAYTHNIKISKKEREGSGGTVPTI